MQRLWYVVAFLAIAASISTGCTMCPDVDESYGYYGGLYQRPDPAHGRAGSILTSRALSEDEGTVIGDEVIGDEVIEDAVTDDAVILDENSYYDEIDPEFSE